MHAASNTSRKALIPSTGDRLETQQKAIANGDRTITGTTPVYGDRLPFTVIDLSLSMTEISSPETTTRLRHHLLLLLLITLGLIVVVNVHDLFAHLAGVDYWFPLMGFDSQLAVIEFVVPFIQALGTLITFVMRSLPMLTNFIIFHHIRAADESISTVGKRLSNINVENVETNWRAFGELLFTTSNALQHLSGVILFEETLYQKTVAVVINAEIQHPKTRLQ